MQIFTLSKFGINLTSFSKVTAHKLTFNFKKLWWKSWAGSDLIDPKFWVWKYAWLIAYFLKEFFFKNRWFTWVKKGSLDLLYLLPNNLKTQLWQRCWILQHNANILFPFPCKYPLYNHFPIRKFRIWFS